MKEEIKSVSSDSTQTAKIIHRLERIIVDIGDTYNCLADKLQYVTIEQPASPCDTIGNVAADKPRPVLFNELHYRAASIEDKVERLRALAASIDI